MIAFLRAIGLMGMVVFAVLFIAVALMPKELERSAVGFVKAQITSDIQARYPALGPEGLTDGLQTLSDRLGLKRVQLDKDIKGDLPELVAVVVAGLCGCDGPPNAQIAATVRESMKARIANLGVAQSKLAEIIAGRYDSIIAALRVDVMIFLGTNALAFCGVVAVCFTPTQMKPLVIYPALMLILAVTSSTAIYVLSTNWFYAILFQDYWGYSYGALMMVIFAFLIDIAMNRARVTLRIVENLPSALVPSC